MKELLDKLNKVFENRVRLGVMSLLMVNEKVDFVTLKKSLAVSDGNLASHVKMLMREEYIEENKKFVNRKPQTTYAATKKGRKAFEAHLDALEQFVKNREQRTGTKDKEK